MFKFITIISLAALAAQAQTQTATVNGKLVLDNSVIAKKLYGRIPVFHGTTTVKNVGPATVQIGGADINLALSTMPTISSSEGAALTNQAYQKQTPQRIANIVTMVASGVGLASGIGGGIAISMKALAFLLFGVSFGQQGVLPFFQAGNPPAPMFTPCDQLNVALAAGMSLTCDEFVEKPSKGATQLPSVVTFDLESVPPVAPLPPVPPVVQLRRKQAMNEAPTINKHTYFVDPDGQLDHLARARKLYFAGEDYPESVRQYNAAMKEHPEDRDGILNEMTGSLYHDGPMGVALADVINNHYSQEGMR